MKPYICIKSESGDTYENIKLKSLEMILHFSLPTAYQILTGLSQMQK